VFISTVLMITQVTLNIRVKIRKFPVQVTEENRDDCHGAL